MRRALVVVAVLVMVVARGEVFAEQSITIATHWTPSDVGHYRILQDAVDEYMKLNPGVLIDIVASRSGSSVLWEMFLVQTAAGTPPDLMQLHTDYIAEYYPAFQPVPRMITELMRQMFYPAALEMVTIEGEYRAIPTEFQVKGVVHNQVMFAEAGVAPLTADPISWDQFWDTAAKLTRVDPDGQVRQSGFAYGEAQHFRTMLVADGYDVITADGDPLLNSPQMLRLVTQWKERVDQGIIAREESWPQGSWHDIHQRRSAMIIMPPWIRDTLVTSDPDGYFANNYVSTPVPYGVLGVPRLRVYGWGWVVPNVARNPELAWDFLIWLNFNVQESGTTRMGDVMAALGSLPATYADFQHQPNMTEPFMHGYMKALSIYDIALLPRIPGATTWSRGFREMITRIVNNEISPINGLETLQVEFANRLAEAAKSRSGS